MVSKKRYLAAFKAQFALEAIQGELTAAHDDGGGVETPSCVWSGGFQIQWTPRLVSKS